MSGKEEKKLEILRSVTKSNAANKTSILVDASKYIKELKDKVEEATAASAATDDSSSSSSSSSSSGSAAVAATVISVSSVDLDDNMSNSSSCGRRGFRINVSMERTRPGLLMSVLDAFEDLGLDVLDADVSCADDTAFRLQALGSGQQQGGSGSVDEQKVRQAVLQAITKCINDDDDE